ncbi:MAG TPA: Asp-tRNA(Asn)/Glu-tRNA(Gln) amidotransferase subunit GatB, partial [Candidatus Saccharimonadales bacterium]|nr:Asp-tRNA(Asn)/Glu-tRNA(Gln) amidotransferase subunit GatB [Candidatus Saccharimonadales bacterium]
ISHIDLGMPGALPVLNEKAIELATYASLALGTEPQKFSTFDRKHYFYPDLPMGYQITQFYHPIIKGGAVTIAVDGEEKQVRIHEAHLEADAGKSIHPAGKDYSLIDLNRAGTPLLEIVSEPDMHSAKEAKIYARELYLLMRYAGVSDADLYYGNMRFDVNVSLSKTDVLGTRTETKNLNSFKSVEKAVEYEIKRQTGLLTKGEMIVQETRGWDDAKQKTFSQRGKEEAHDYRYMPDPDIPPVEITREFVKTIKDSMPPLPGTLRARLQSLQLDSSAVETLVEEMPAGKLIFGLLESNEPPAIVKKVANWLVTDVQAVLTEAENSWEQLRLVPAHLVELARLAQDNKISSTGAKTVLLEMLKTGKPPLQIAETKNVLQVSDESQIAAIVTRVLADNPQAANDVKDGEQKAIGFLVGQVMKESKGKANPTLAQKLLRKQLGL